ncbi:alpha/beta hydrolase [Archangium lipolyticum]|uniref:alpha/beta hydrolase n=1 Tax=Archangium lipolyticum TaxID=2970465 RepID=UPI002149A0B9|nr:alpha/beta hydrolase-fold protein [Archangium lipolyticum]
MKVPTRIIWALRRLVLVLGGGGFAAVLFLACEHVLMKESADGAPPATSSSEKYEVGRLLSRPGAPTVEAPERGLRPLGFGGERDGLLYVPEGYRADRPAPLLVMLHGSKGTAREALEPWLELADGAGLLLLAPESRVHTWDIVLLDGGYGPDVTFIDRALVYVFERYAVDPRHLVLAGFSDGASFALSLGLTNGDLFSHVVAFSPGFAEPAMLRGRPELFISHGSEDPVLPVADCGRSIASRVKDAGYTVRYREFDGPHTVPSDIVREALVWFITP